jgi:hypothetical protein
LSVMDAARSIQVVQDNPAFFNADATVSPSLYMTF